MRETYTGPSKKNIFLNEYPIDNDQFDYFDKEHLSRVVQQSPELSKVYLKRQFMEYVEGKEPDFLMPWDLTFVALNADGHPDAQPWTFTRCVRETFSTLDEFRDKIHLLRQYKDSSQQEGKSFLIHVTLGDTTFSFTLQNWAIIPKERLAIDLAFDFNTRPRGQKELFDKYFAFKNTLVPWDVFAWSGLNAMFEKEANYDHIKTKDDEKNITTLFQAHIFGEAHSEVFPQHHKIMRQMIDVSDRYFNQMMIILSKVYQKHRPNINLNEWGKRTVPSSIVKAWIHALREQHMIGDIYLDTFVKKIFCDMRKREVRRPDTSPGFVDKRIVLTAFLKHLFFPDQPLVIVSKDMDIKVIFHLFIHEIIPRYFAQICLERKKKQFPSRNAFDQYVKSLYGKGDKNKAYYEHMIQPAKEFIQAVYERNISTKDDQLKEVFYLINPLTKKFSTITIIRPVFHFLRGNDNFVVGKTQVLDYALQHDLPPLKALDTLETEEIRRLKGDLENVLLDESGKKGETSDGFADPEGLWGGEFTE